MKRKPLHLRLIKWIRDLRSQAFIEAIRTYISGDVIDIGGGDFFLSAKKYGFSYKSWTTLESSKENLFELQGMKNEDFSYVLGDGCRASEYFKDKKFDSLINAQVLEHVLEPNRMVEECSKILKTGGKGVFLIPQTSAVHMAPDHYYNFTRFWIEQVMKRNQLRIKKLKPIGGLWSTQASHLVYLFLKVMRLEGYSFAEAKRKPLYWVLLPFMILYAVVSLPIVMTFSLADLTEEPNNHLVIVEKINSGKSDEYA